MLSIHRISAFIAAVAIATGLFAGHAHAQSPGSIVWEDQGYVDTQAVATGSTYSTAGITVAFDWTMQTDGGVVAYSGLDFASYGATERGAQTGNLEFGFDNDSADPDDRMIADFTFPGGVTDLQFSLLDIDQSSWDDIVEVYYDTGSGFQNATSTPYWTLGGANVALDNETFADGWEGTGNADPGDPSSNISFDFASEQVLVLRIVYFAGDDVGGDPGGQVMGVSDITFITAPSGPGGGGSGVCPAGMVVTPQTGNLVSTVVDVSTTFDTRAHGALSAAGTSPPNNFSAEMDSGTDQFTLDFNELIPEGATITLSLGRDGGFRGDQVLADILFSTTQNGTYTSVGTYGTGGTYPPTVPQDILERIDVTVPAGGARFIRFDTLNNDDLFIDGAQYYQICADGAVLSGSKSMQIYDPNGDGLYAIPGNDVIYTINVENTGLGNADNDSVVLIDTMPGQVEFFNGDIDTGGPNTYPGTDPVAFVDNGSGLSFNYASDVRYSNSGTRPANFAACNYAPLVGYDANVTFICLNPKGTMPAGNPNPEFSVSFRARIQ